MFERGKLFVVVVVWFFRISWFGFGAKSGVSKKSLKEVTVNDFIVKFVLLSQVCIYFTVSAPLR